MSVVFNNYACEEWLAVLGVRLLETRSELYYQDLLVVSERWTRMSG